ncbi:MAG: DEAD/DEAH box helicase [Clostridia bacterium]|nr:DEAD/DEAH box helicase [Clostridia bacterium]
MWEENIMAFSPVAASKNLEEKYIRYLKTIFKLNDAIYSHQFENELSNKKLLAKGPYLDVTDAFVKGKSISELIKAGVLAEGFSKIKIPQTRSLYIHQEKAVLKVQNSKNIVVSTGTGSGKTESFLLPIFDHLIREDDANKLTPGVRALIIYPMNALANDQVERLRGLLSEYPEITYGSYTGQTKQTYDDALADYSKLNNGEIPLPNELISREQMKKTPPHILITNYAMLEYLMLRPDDSVFFDGGNAENWKFIVLDEAHVYNGSTGIEVSMLLRRLKAKIMKENLRYILTSATLGGDDENKEVAQFAENLCDSHFDAEDVIRAERVVLETTRQRSNLKVSFYNEIADLINDKADDAQIVDAICRMTKKEYQGSFQEVLYDAVLHDENYWQVRRYLKTTKTVLEISKLMTWTQQEVENFVTVASKAEIGGDRLFDARYHMFLRATDSVFITLTPSSKLFLTRKSLHYEGEEEYKVFEIATCSVCHAIYLVGKIEGDYLEQSNVAEDNMRSVFLLGDSISDSDEEHSLENENIKVTEYELCARCGYIRKAGAVNAPSCEHGDSYYVKAFRIDIDNPSHTLTKCLSCENTNATGILRMFFTGQEASTSVVGTALFEELPSYSIKTEMPQILNNIGFDFGSPEGVESKVNLAKQFIAFSDSRQAAAFYSSYLDQTYRSILYKRLIIETLKDQIYSDRGKSFTSFIEDLIFQFERYKIAGNDNDVLRKEAWKSGLHEIVDNNGITSLLSMGLLNITLDKTDMPNNAKYSLSKEVVGIICDVFASGIMADAALLYSEPLNKADKEFFTHNGVEYSYTLSDSDNKKYRRCFIPKNSNLSNKRLDYLVKVLRKLGNDISDEESRKILESFWMIFKQFKFMIPTEGNQYRLDVGKIRIGKPTKWYQCPKCKRITIYNAVGVCPSYKCDGELVPIDLEEIYQDNHYYRIYKELDIRELRVVEHTAQLDKETAYNYQRKFKQKEIDILSCSTTFEMGVDVGTLETVFMRNMPPSPSNYAQRAGRAGRSTSSAAYAVTFCNKSSHDFSFYNAPDKMIKGKIPTPKFNVENNKIAIRHVYASSLAFFWKQYPKYFSNATSMIEQDEGQPSGYDFFENYLLLKPDELRKYLIRFLPDKLSIVFDVQNFGWVNNLISKESGVEGLFIKAIREYEYEVNILQEAIDRAIESGGRVDNLRSRVRVYRNEAILSFLSRKNILPKYGFPVDTVEIFIVDKTNNTKLGLQLQRDLSMAISEYAPGSQIVANGNLITSKFIRKIPNMSWKEFDYIWCDACHTLNIEPHVSYDEPSNLKECRQCGKLFDGISRKVFLIPEFGFEADGDKIKKPGLKKPQRTHKGDIAYIGYQSEIETYQYKIGNSNFELGMSQNDEMAVLNESKFFVCEHCGYTELDEKEFKGSKRSAHNNPAGYPCRNDGTNRLKKFALGYRFETDVVQLKFMNPDLTDWEMAVSVLHGVLRGVYRYLNIEESDVSGCLQSFQNTFTNRHNYELVLYDKTPGGAGHVRRLKEENVLEGVLRETLKLMEDCDCGGEQKDSSCYTCLRGYYNQKHHDILKRSYVIDFLNNILG